MTDSQRVLVFLRRLRDLWLTEDDIAWGVELAPEVLRPILYFFWKRSYLQRRVEGDGICWRWRWHAAS